VGRMRNVVVRIVRRVAVQFDLQHGCLRCYIGRNPTDLIAFRNSARA
jgi:hypothetical protein